MSHKKLKGYLMGFCGIALVSTALATPALPAANIAEQAVKEALTEPTIKAAVKPAAKPAQAKPTPAPAAKTAAKKPATTAATARAKGVQNANAAAKKVITARGRSMVVRATAYNSLPNQTDRTPHITATGTRTRFGVVALSRDLLRKYPYGTRIVIEDLTGRYSHLLKGRVFIVEDTMHPRKYNQLDIWMSSRSDALNWGARSVRITAVN